MSAIWEEERRGYALAGRIRTEVVSVIAVGALLSARRRKLQVRKTKSNPAAIHGIEAYLVSVSALASLRTACFCNGCTVLEMPMANVGAALSLLDGLQGERPSFSCGLVQKN